MWMRAMFLQRRHYDAPLGDHGDVVVVAVADDEAARVVIDLEVGAGARDEREARRLDVYAEGPGSLRPADPARRWRVLEFDRDRVLTYIGTCCSSKERAETVAVMRTAALTYDMFWPLRAGVEVRTAEGVMAVVENFDPERPGDVEGLDRGEEVAP